MSGIKFLAFSGLLVLVAVIAVGCVAQNTPAQNNTASEQLPANHQETSAVPNTLNTSTTAPPQETSPPLLIKSLAVDMGPYDPATNKAGDFVFTRNKLEFDRLFFDYGFSIPGNSAGAAKVNPQPTFIVPLGTKVHALVDGLVVKVPKLYSNDYSIHVAKYANSRFIYETEHVINPLVKVGDVVSAGQVIATVSDYDTRNTPGFGLVEIGILHAKEDGTPGHVCPFLYLDPSIEEDVYTSLRGFYKAWNNYLGKEVYNESEYTVPGCLTLDELRG